MLCLLAKNKQYQTLFFLELQVVPQQICCEYASASFVYHLNMHFSFSFHSKSIPLQNLIEELGKQIYSFIVTYLFNLSHLLLNRSDINCYENTTKKMPINDQEFFTDPKSPLKKSYFLWQNKALTNTW